MCFFNDTATTEIYTLSLHDALPIFVQRPHQLLGALVGQGYVHDGGVYSAFGHPLAALGYRGGLGDHFQDRKSTRLNSSHANISYAVFCLKKKKNINSVYDLHKTYIL